MSARPLPDSRSRSSVRGDGLQIQLEIKRLISLSSAAGGVNWGEKARGCSALGVALRGLWEEGWGHTLRQILVGGEERVYEGPSFPVASVLWGQVCRALCQEARPWFTVLTYLL